MSTLLCKSLSNHVALPRGCREELERLLEELGIGVDLRDERNGGRPLETSFLGELTPKQWAAAEALHCLLDRFALSAAPAHLSSAVDRGGC